LIQNVITSFISILSIDNMLKEIGRTTSNSLQSFARPDLSAEALAGYAQYTISFEVFTPLLLS
jgi:hypothetical protein